MPKARSIMVQGTASNAGKSIIAAGLCRVFKQDCWSVAPFKSQNMALNSFITREGLEMGRAQVTQAEAAGIEPSVLMNPVLLKPTGDAKSQVIVNGEVWANLAAGEYYAKKQELRPLVQKVYGTLAARHDIIVIEGAGSPAEINLQADDFVNMGMAAMADAPVLLVGDIDRGGVFASLYGTVMLLGEEDRRRIKGIIINKFRGDEAILCPGLAELEKLCGIPVLGVVPYVELDLDDEDSVSSRLAVRETEKPVDVAVIRLPRISNFTDFTSLGQHPALGVRYVESVRGLGTPDLIILPGTKNTMADLGWMRENGLEAAVKKQAENGVPLLGICGGYQMLGEHLVDPQSVEQGGEMRGMELLPIKTVFAEEKTRTRIKGTVNTLEGSFAALSGADFEGYEIHMGESAGAEVQAFAALRGGAEDARPIPDGAVQDNVLGSYVHGLFDSGEIPSRLAEMLLARKGMSLELVRDFDYEAHKQAQFDLLADTLRQALDMEAIYSMIGVKR